ncbi:MAG: TRAP transporter substrate-binding protein DctP [Alphaproteobacteria bacterium]
MSIRSSTSCVISAAVGVLALVGVEGAFAAKVEGPKVNWDLNTWGAKRAATAGAEELSRLVGEATDGNFAIKVHYGEALGPIKEALDGLNIGAYQVTYTCLGYTPGKMPTFDGISLPFLPATTMREQQAMRDGFLTSPIPHRDAARWGISTILVQPNSPSQLIGKGKVPQSLNDLKGLRVRAIGGDAAALRLIGVSAQNMPMTEVYGAVERGLLDAASSIYSSLAAFKMQEVSNWYTTNMAISITGCMIFAGTKAMDSLPPQYKKLVMDSVPAVNDYWANALTRDDNIAIDAFKAKGLVPVAFKDSELAELGQKVRPIWDAWVEQVDKLGYNGKELLQIILDSARKAKTS